MIGALRVEAVARPRQLSRDPGEDRGRKGRDRDQGRGSENSASRLPWGEAVPLGTTSLLYHTCRKRSRKIKKRLKRINVDKMKNV